MESHDAEFSDHGRTPPIADACTNPVTKAVEGYSPRDGLAHGSLDVVMLACLDHVSAARQKWIDEGLSPHTANQNGSALGCGHVTDFRQRRTVQRSVTSDASAPAAQIADNERLMTDGVELPEGMDSQNVNASWVRRERHARNTTT